MPRRSQRAFAATTRFVKTRWCGTLPRFLIQLGRRWWNGGLSESVDCGCLKGGFKEVFVDMFKVFNGKDRFIEVQKEKYKDGRVKVLGLIFLIKGCL